MDFLKVVNKYVTEKDRIISGHYGTMGDLMSDLNTLDCLFEQAMATYLKECLAEWED